MPHSVDIPPPDSGGQHESSKCVMFSENHPAIAAGTTTYSSPTYRRTVPSYFSSHGYSGKDRGRGRCRCCLCCCCFFLLLLLLIFSALLLYVRFLFKPEAPSYEMKQLSVKDFAMRPADAGAATLSVALALWVEADNPNTKIGIVYGSGGTMEIRSQGTRVASSDLPVFSQAPRNTTNMLLVMEGQSNLSAEQKVALLESQKEGRVPLQAAVRAPLGFTAGKLELLRMVVYVDCDLVANRLSPGMTTTVDVTGYNVSLDF